MDGMSYVRLGEEPYMQLDKMKLRNYFPHEIEKLSVVRITQTKTFDEIGHPVKGGLYDPAMGPHNTDRCETCHQYQVHCPGHIGHLRLDVPVFNPLLFSFSLNLLKGSCVQCHRLTCGSDSIDAKVLLVQLRCFELGVPHLVQAMASIYKDRLTNMDVSEKITLEEEMQILAEVDKMISKAEGKPYSKLKGGIPDKNTVDLRKEVVSNFLRSHLFKRREKCPLCKGKNGKLTNDQARCIILNFSSTSKGKKVNTYRDEFEVEESENESDKENDLGDLEKLGYGGVEVTEGTLEEQLIAVQKGSCDKLAWRAAEVREHFRLLFKNDGEFLLKVFPLLNDEGAKDCCPLDGLFSELIMVPPTKFRPIRLFQGQNYEDPQSVNLRKLLEATETIKAISLVMKGDKSASLAELITTRVMGRTINAKMHNAYVFLQQKMNAIFDEELDHANDKLKAPGIKQILEKKQGLFRMNMMGKRVNYACRSVITPDPYLDIDEIGIPEVFAKKLTFSEPVNIYNMQYLRKLVENGNEKHPGANFVFNSNQKKVILTSDKEKHNLKTVSKSLQSANGDYIKGPMKVLRHLRNGDMMLMNRQPSLHKPSILGHRCRVLRGQKALRMNYAPCKAYNADFDGDEMNGHLVQSFIAQSEVSEIANVGSNLLVPKDATPLLGLIQDHVVSGVLLTLRGRFLNKEDFMHLVLAAFSETSERIEIPPPCMLKPQVLYSGKQVISCIMKNCIPEGKPLINLAGKAKTPLSCWRVRGYSDPQFDMSESEVVFRQGELLVGVLDKAHYGATQYGLAHCCFELYGPKIGVKVLSCFSRLFTTYLQFHGFTLGVADILIRKEADQERTKHVLESRTIGNQVVIKTFALSENATEAEIKNALATTYNNPAGQGTDVKMLDYGMKQGISKYNEAITKACVPTGLIRSFPENALQVMIQSGAKGSSVNAIQISCCLGQIELEGKRMAVTVAGRTLPSFKAYDPSPRAGGFIDQRFLTGINPQELFFHTMAGREGLIDTAVKTSRSGYLQRCIIKHLEGIKVHYDSTVRDHDGSIIQFRYGEDGLDTCKASFLSPKTFKFLEDNIEAATMCCKPKSARDADYSVYEAEKQYHKIQKWKRKKAKRNIQTKLYQSGFTEFSAEHIGADKKAIVGMWAELSASEKKVYEKRAPSSCPTPVDEKFNVNRVLGALPEKTLDQIYASSEDNEKLKRTLMWKGMQSLATAGENVGLLAAQSIGEPSTQMTLNTFHFAGRGEMNVTLGIPRLREILMTASQNIATPSAQIAILPGSTREQIDKIKQDLDRVFLNQVLRNFKLEDRINLSNGERWRRYSLRLELLPAERREKGTQHLKRRKIMKEIEKRFLKNIAKVMETKIKAVSTYQSMQTRKLRQGNLAAGVGTDAGDPRQRRRIDDGASSDEEADGGQDADAAERRLHNRHNDEAADYEGEDEDRGAVEMEDPNETVAPEGEPEEEKEGSEDDESQDDEATKKDEDNESPEYRVRHVIQSASLIVEYEFDTKKDRWCRAVFQTPLSSKTKLDMASIIDYEISKFIVHQTPGIERCVEDKQMKDGKEVTYIQTQGVNLQALFRHSDCLDVNSVYSNDLNLILNQYGVEACARAIVTEMANVFGVYGIDVSKRHLSLTADYMTFTGIIAPFNRGAMSSSASPLQKMTFETTIAFLRESILHGQEDHLTSPSARLVVGSLNRGGTGSFDLMSTLKYSNRFIEKQSFSIEAKRVLSSKRLLYGHETPPLRASEHFDGRPIAPDTVVDDVGDQPGTRPSTALKNRRRIPTI
ncbi:unnamed protein product [Auanema sp. JU1783]|nr:unnamed protein product [Auanema sp. JU1783]